MNDNFNVSEQSEAVSPTGAQQTPEVSDVPCSMTQAAVVFVVSVISVIVLDRFFLRRFFTELCADATVFLFSADARVWWPDCRGFWGPAAV